MTRARQLADLISDGVIGTTELADDVITPIKLDETGNYTVASLAVTGSNLTFGDNNKAQFGAGNDLQIYHDGSNSYVAEGGSGTGNLIIKGNSVLIRNNSDENYIHGISNGEVRLYYDNAQKLATTSSGIDVTGTTQADSFTLDNGSNDWTFTVSGNNLIFSYAGTAKMKLDTSGNLTVTGDIISEGTI